MSAHIHEPGKRFRGPFPVTRPLRREIEAGYGEQTGAAVVETSRERGLEPLEERHSTRRHRSAAYHGQPL